MSLISWARERLGITDGGRLSALFGGSNWAGKPVTVNSSLQLSAWWRSVKLYAEVTGALPLKFYERKADDDRVRVHDHDVASLISWDPNIDQTAQEFWAGQAASLCIVGNSYAEKLFVGDKLVGLQPMPLETHCFRNSNDELRYQFSDRGKPAELSADKVFHTKGFNLGGDMGLSPLASARQTISLSLATEETAGKHFAHGMRSSGYFTLPPGTKNTPGQRDDFRKTFIDPMVGNNADVHIGLMEGGIDFKAININPKDAEMLLSRRFNVEEICRFMGVPPILVGHAAEGQTMWGSGVENIMLAWLTLGLNSFLSNIEKSINKRLLKPDERRKYYAEFDRNALLQADSGKRGELYWKLVQLAALTPNQICDKENFPRFEGGDTRLVNSTLQPLAMLGQKPPARIQPAPGDPIPEPTP